MIDLILSFPFIFVISLVFSLMIYLIGSLVSPKGKDTVEKFSTYACGEDLPARKLQSNINNFFIYVTFFMIFDISAFILALSFESHGLFPAIFITITACSALTLLPAMRGR
jgi:NADH:ubiquinone oxidoreductase subunit 3 (subunit A)